ncbi:SMI1/KNR4 family protein [Nannocystis sp. ILAH1]|uniref:SMI1/KNR4 family protein n=1 Tax=Nannocystis sp. ILAH1 TaxID=2996789 RepID=UPI002271004B|nr:SMI1/KNR4 family protein [Nannocystis sp. ILAH1]MCY0992542.1 SMI1/KNR4 family protein [Nannocystis sp. ILAH1]
MDSELAEVVAELKDIFTRRGIPTRFGRADPAVVDELRRELRIPARYRGFLQASDPVDVETVTPAERVRLFPADRLVAEQPVGEAGWQNNWVAIARSTLRGDLYFLDISKLDAESDCPVFSVTTGAASYRPELCASSFEQFLRSLAKSMEAAA